MVPEFSEVNDMVIGFVIWSICAGIFIGIGVSSMKAKEAVGFFTFVKPPVVKDIRQYNDAVSRLWFVVAGLFEILGVPFLFLEQNSPLFLVSGFGVVVLLIGMMIAYMKIESKYGDEGI